MMMALDTVAMGLYSTFVFVANSVTFARLNVYRFR
jgi:hypothetical protein